MCAPDVIEMAWSGPGQVTHARTPLQRGAGTPSESGPDTPAGTVAAKKPRRDSPGGRAADNATGREPPPNGHPGHAVDGRWRSVGVVVAAITGDRSSVNTLAQA